MVQDFPSSGYIVVWFKVLWLRDSIKVWRFRNWGVGHGVGA